MKPGPALLKIINRKYEASATICCKFKSYDIALKTDKDGNAVLLFIGKTDDRGKIKGKRFARTLKRDRDGQVIKDHWELKGKAT